MERLTAEQILKNNSLWLPNIAHLDLLNAMLQFANQEKEIEAKKFAEYFEKYVAYIDEMVNGTCKDMRLKKDRPIDYDYYNFNTKQWAKDFDELYKQFKQQK